MGEAFPPDVRAEAVRLFLAGGVTLRDVAEHVRRAHGRAIHLTTIRGWVLAAPGGPELLRVRRRQLPSRRACGYCGELGHYRPRCPHRPADEPAAERTDPSADCPVCSRPIDRSARPSSRYCSDACAIARYRTDGGENG